MRSAWSVLASLLLVTGALQAADVKEASIGAKIASLKETAGPRDWRKLPWAATLLDARKVSAQEQTPVFLFTYDGNIDSGRC